MSKIYCSSSISALCFMLWCACVCAHMCVCVFARARIDGCSITIKGGQCICMYVCMYVRVSTWANGRHVGHFINRRSNQQQSVRSIHIGWLKAKVGLGIYYWENVD